jgi:hypothetical protein
MDKKPEAHISGLHIQDQGASGVVRAWWDEGSEQRRCGSLIVNGTMIGTKRL